MKLERKDWARASFLQPGVYAGLPLSGPRLAKREGCLDLWEGLTGIVTESSPFHPCNEDVMSDNKVNEFKKYDSYCDTWNFMKEQLIYKTETDSDIESKLGYQREKEGPG